ncbi:hypothetical protein EKO23_16295 [Nocardioides guangzhouensis]|uniref:Large polyvalent protein associated domain-containing protein n=1 Tax=Nocardioides guangzhouensis TaxID=2497878 RepID=A0A4Q4Z8K3_9ACTN|nr:LPD29 domain-containing protein [Nocardioides guangzhouensis]RYP84220.1 hypothetical protein EKO23_16295 [Nocardioides guangzhouensis]
MTSLPLNPRVSDLRVPFSAPVPVRHGRADHHLSTKDTAALLRLELKRHFPHGRFSVRVEHEWHGWIRVRVTNAPPSLVEEFTRQLELLRYDTFDDDHWNHALTVEEAGKPCRMTNRVRSIKVEWAD